MSSGSAALPSCQGGARAPCRSRPTWGEDWHGAHEISGFKKPHVGFSSGVRIRTHRNREVCVPRGTSPRRVAEHVRRVPIPRRVGMRARPLGCIGEHCHSVRVGGPAIMSGGARAPRSVAPHVGRGLAWRSRDLWDSKNPTWGFHRVFEFGHIGKAPLGVSGYVTATRGTFLLSSARTRAPTPAAPFRIDRSSRRARPRQIGLEAKSHVGLFSWACFTSHVGLFRTSPSFWQAAFGSKFRFRNPESHVGLFKPAPCYVPCPPTSASARSTGWPTTGRSPTRTSSTTTSASMAHLTDIERHEPHGHDCGPRVPVRGAGEVNGRGRGSGNQSLMRIRILPRPCTSSSILPSPIPRSPT